MPSFGEALTSEQIDDVIEYVRSFCRNPHWPRGELNLPLAFATEKAFPEDEVVIRSTLNAQGAPGVTNEIVHEQRFGVKNQIEVVFVSHVPNVGIVSAAALAEIEVTFDEVGQDPSYFTLTKFSIEQSDRVTAVSAFLREQTYRAFGCAGCDVVVIPNFVTTAEYHPPTAGTCRGSLAPADHKVLVHISNFRPVKRVRDVVRVFAGVRRALPATLVLVGDGPDRDAAEQEADQLQLRRDIRFLGKVDNVADILRGSDLFLLPSETESFGLAALEAMACGVPVLASAVGGLPEVVVDGETGLLTPPGDVNAMIANGVRILGDAALHARFRDAAARRALEFTADRIVPRYERLYEEVLGA